MLLLKKLNSDIGKMALIVLFLVAGVFAPIAMLVTVIPDPGSRLARLINILLWALLWGPTAIFARTKILNR